MIHSVRLAGIIVGGDLFRNALAGLMSGSGARAGSPIHSSNAAGASGLRAGVGAVTCHRL